MSLVKLGNVKTHFYSGGDVTSKAPIRLFNADLTVQITNKVGSYNLIQLENLIKDQMKDIWRNHLEELRRLANGIRKRARYLVPVDTGKLRDSITVVANTRGRYPGLIAYAYANSGGKPGRPGYDYAIAQEYDEEYSHDEPWETAHYLGGSFAGMLAYWYKNITGKYLQMPAALVRAANYVAPYIKAYKTEGGS